MKDKFIKNGVFSLEYDKETLRDMVLELQEENQKLKAELQLYQGALKRENEAIHRVNDLEEENQELKAEYGTKAQVERDLLKEENEKYKEVIDDAIQFIKDTCIEQVPDMPKGCYREIASIGDLLDLLDILKEVK